MDIPFRIANTTIDLGKDGKFGPGREAELMETLKKRKDGETLFNSFVNRGAIVEAEPEPAASKTDGNAGQAGAASPAKTTDQGTKKEPAATPDYEPTEKYEAVDYGEQGSWHHIVDPAGFIIKKINGKEKAEQYAADLNEQLTQES